MTFSILITTLSTTTGGVALNTLVQDFPSRREADIALSNIKQFSSHYISYYAVQLYEEL